MSELNVPGEYNLDEASGVPTFENSETGKKLQKKYDDAQVQANDSLKTLKWSMWGVVAVGVIASGVTGGFSVLLWILAFFMRKNGVFANKIRNNLNSVSQVYSDFYYKYIDKIISGLTNKISMPNWRSYRNGTQALIYNDQGFIYFNVEDNFLTIYNKNDIKEVSRERVHTGSHTTQSSNTFGGGSNVGDTNLIVGGARTSTNADTNDFYEWHFDILTDFISYPKVSFVLPDSQSVEDFVGEAYAVLKP
ncbi:hypothetical protein R4B61_02770 [Fructilactobacillus vespulae]|uniref:hypothetical protein n=1 Tax=Fructilactobacillus vespulae TaxID=1249630 RepID=UPI0039B6D23C